MEQQERVKHGPDNFGAGYVDAMIRRLTLDLDKVAKGKKKTSLQSRRINKIQRLLLWWLGEDTKAPTP